MIQSFWLVLLTWKSLWVMLLLAFILLGRLVYNKNLSFLILLFTIIFLVPLLLGLSGSRFISIDNIQIICTFVSVLMLFRPLRKEFVQNIFVIHLFVLGLVLYNQNSVFIFILMFFDSLFVIALIFLIEQYPLSLGSLKDLTGSMFKVLVQTIPFIIVFYGLIPALSFKNNNRFDASFSGASFAEEVKPGKIDRLILSDRPMFTVRFLSKHLPIRDQFYWRTQIFPTGDGLNWKLAEKTILKEAEKIEIEDNTRAILYNLWPDKNLYPIIPTLEFFTGVHKSESDSYLVNTDGALQMVEVPKEGESITLVSNMAPFNRGDSTVHPAANLGSKSTPSERVQALISSWQRNSHTPEDFFQQIANFFQENRFIYSLSPGKIYSADQFLFETRTGFCEHYAAVTAYLFQLAGYQARVVTGFQGGEPASEPGLWELTGKDAHAWLEVWSEEAKVWQRYDAIAFIAPERLKWGGQRYFSLMERGSLATLLPDVLRVFFWQGLRRAKQWAFYIQSIGDKFIDELVEIAKGVFESHYMTLLLFLLVALLILIPIFNSRKRIWIKILDILFKFYVKNYSGFGFKPQSLFFKEGIMQDLEKFKVTNFEAHQRFIQAWLVRRYDPTSRASDWWFLFLAFLDTRKR